MFHLETVINNIKCWFLCPFTFKCSQTKFDKVWNISHIYWCLLYLQTNERRFESMDRVKKNLDFDEHEKQLKLSPSSQSN